jgi:hypothetical protein
MKAIKMAGVMVFMFCVFVVSSHAQTVQADFDRSYDFSKLKTFNFAIPNFSDPLAQDSLNDGRIRNALESRLTVSGFRMESTATPDFTVAYYVTTKNKVSVQDYSYGPPRWFGRRDISVNQYTEGTLTVDVIDVKTRQLVWRGRASGTLELKDMDKKINKAVEKLVNKFVKDSTKKG